MIWLCTELWESNQCPEHERNKKTLVYCMLIPTDQMLTDGCDGSLPTYRLLDPALFPALYPITQLLFKWHVQPCNAACRSPLAADHLFFWNKPNLWTRCMCYLSVQHGAGGTDCEPSSHLWCAPLPAGSGGGPSWLPPSPPSVHPPAP